MLTEPVKVPAIPRLPSRSGEDGVDSGSVESGDCGGVQILAETRREGGGAVGLERLPVDGEAAAREGAREPDAAVVVGFQQKFGGEAGLVVVVIAEDDDLLHLPRGGDLGEVEEARGAVAVEHLRTHGEVALGNDARRPSVAQAIDGDYAIGGIVALSGPAGVGELLFLPEVLLAGVSLNPAVGHELGHGVAAGAKVGEGVGAVGARLGHGFAGVVGAVVVLVQIDRPLLEVFLGGALYRVVVAVEPEVPANLGGSEQVAYGGGGLQFVARQVGGVVVDG